MAIKMIQVIMIIVIAVLVAIDQLIKYLINTNMEIGSFKEIIPNFFGLHYVRNSGAAFSILEGKRLVLIIVTGLVLIGCLIYLLKRIRSYLLEKISLIMIISGGIGNLIDRIFRNGLVIDYIRIDFYPAIFNFADCLVTVGVVLFLLALILDIVKEAKQKKMKNAEAAEQNLDSNE